MHLYLEYDETVYTGLVIDYVDTDARVVGFKTRATAALRADMEHVIVAFQPWSTAALPGNNPPSATSQRYHAYLSDAELLLDADTPARRWR